jgi:hypothetical protein
LKGLSVSSAYPGVSGNQGQKVAENAEVGDCLFCAITLCPLSVTVAKVIPALAHSSELQASAAGSILANVARSAGPRLPIKPLMAGNTLVRLGDGLRSHTELRSGPRAMAQMALIQPELRRRRRAQIGTCFPDLASRLP